MAEEFQKIYCGGQWMATSNKLEVLHPFDNSKIKTTYQASKNEIDQAINAGVESQKDIRKLKTWQRKKILQQIVQGIKDQKEQFVDSIIFESGKPYKYALGEVNRAIQTFTIAAEEAGRVPGEMISLDWQENIPPRDGVVKYFPVGLVAGIAPFNFPLNLVAHKVAPALAAGCPIIIKPASKTPLTALRLAEIIHRTDWPEGAFSVLPCNRSAGNMLVEDERIKLLSFTGSPEVGWKMKSNAGKKKVVLELGGNAGAIVHHDANVETSVEELMVGGFAYSGQVCIHTQRILVHKDVQEEFVKAYVDRTKSLKSGDPFKEDTAISSMIDHANAVRIKNWVTEAVSKGAKLLCGGAKEGSFYQPTVLENVDRSIKIYREEAFGPVVIIESYEKIDEAISLINDSKFGLQAAVFTENEKVIDQCFHEIEVGGVVHNSSTTFRADHMPYGGVKDSGLGREGVKYAMIDMLEPRILVKNRLYG